MDTYIYGLNIFMPHGLIMFSTKVSKYITKNSVPGIGNVLYTCCPGESKRLPKR